MWMVQLDVDDAQNTPVLTRNAFYADDGGLVRYTTCIKKGLQGMLSTAMSVETTHGMIVSRRVRCGGVHNVQQRSRPSQVPEEHAPQPLALMGAFYKPRQICKHGLSGTPRGDHTQVGHEGSEGVGRNLRGGSSQGLEEGGFACTFAG